MARVLRVLCLAAVLHSTCRTLGAQFPEAEKALAATLADIAAEEAHFSESVRPDDKEWVKRRLEHLYNVDQKARGAYMKAPPAEWSAEAREFYRKGLARFIMARDRANTGEVKELLKKYGWFTISAFDAKTDGFAWVLVQHADLDVAFQQEVLATLATLYPNGETKPANFANLWDRVAKNTGKPQRYGTQGRCTAGNWEPYEIEDPANLDRRRASVGLSTMAEYLRFSKEGRFCGK